MRLMVYSHDTYGLGNIRRILAICEHLLDSIPELSILLVSGSPVVHSFRIPPGLDYIKLPCIERNIGGEISNKYLNNITTEEVLKIRAELIRTAAINYQPDLVLVDKKPYALKGELKGTLNYLKAFLPSTKVVLLLRDILDTPEKTIAQWKENRYYEGIEAFYHRILIVGMQEVFDVTKEYQFPDYISKKVSFCGYIRRKAGYKAPELLRQELQVKPDEKLVLVTAGGGGDGYKLVQTYLSGIIQLSGEQKIKTVIISGPEMPLDQQQEFAQIAAQNDAIQLIEFTDDLNSYMTAADLVVSMGGYNSVCEILSLNKKAVIVPRTQPVQEQWIRAQRMARLGLFKAIHPDKVTPEIMLQAVREQLNNNNHQVSPLESIVDLDGLPRISEYISALLKDEESKLVESEFDIHKNAASIRSLFSSTAALKM